MSDVRIPPLGADNRPMLTMTQEHAANWRARAEKAEAQLQRLRALDLTRATRVIRRVAGGQKRHPNTAAMLRTLADELATIGGDA